MCYHQTWAVPQAARPQSARKMAARKWPTALKAMGTAATGAARDGSADPFAPACIPRNVGDAKKRSTPRKATDTVAGGARTAQVVDPLVIRSNQSVQILKNQSAREIAARR